MPKLVDITNDGETATKPLMRQPSVQSTKSNASNNTITATDVSENQSSAVGTSLPSDGSMSRTPSIKRGDSVKSQNSIGASGDLEPLIEQTKTTDVLSEP